MRGRCTGCDARTSTDWLHLRDALRGRYCAMRCAVVVRDAMRGLVAFARCSCKRRQRHAFDGGILRVDFLGSVQH
jgi:hypothetical protein